MEVTMEKKGIKDLTHGNPMKLILQFGVPLLFGLIFQQFYNLVDSIIVGKLLGVNALAAVGSTGSINFMILGFCIGVCNGFAIPVAQAFGAKDMTGVKRYITNSAWMSIIFSVILTTIIGLATHKILEWMNTPASIIKDAYTYIFIIFMGIPLIFLYNMVSAILRSLGNSVAPVVFLVCSSVINIILDIIMIQKMGIAGASVATVIAQGVSGIAGLIYMIKKYWWMFLACVIFATPYPMRIYVKCRKNIVCNIFLFALFWLCVYELVFGTNNPFLYFRF